MTRSSIRKNFVSEFVSESEASLLKLDKVENGSEHDLARINAMSYLLSALTFLLWYRIVLYRCLRLFLAWYL